MSQDMMEMRYLIREGVMGKKTLVAAVFFLFFIYLSTSYIFPEFFSFVLIKII